MTTKPTEPEPPGEPLAPAAPPEPDARAGVPAPHAWSQRQVITMVRWLLYMVYVVIGYTILVRLAPVLTPLLAAAAVGYLLDPLVDRLVARGMKRTWAVSLLLVAFLGTVTGAVMILAPLLAADLGRFIATFPDMVDNAARWVSETFGYEIPASWQDLQSEEVSAMLHSALGPTSGLVAAALGGVLSLLGFLAELLLIPVFAFYILLDWDAIVERIRKLIPPRHRADVTAIALDIDRVVSGWIRGQLTVTATLAVLYAIAFWLIEVPLAVPVGLIVGALTIIPFLGTFVGAAITGVLIVLDWQGASQVGMVSAVFVSLHLLEAAFLTPVLVGKRVGLGELGALFAVLAGGKLLGFAGIVLAVPLAASVAVLVRRGVRFYERTEFFGAHAEAGEAEVQAHVEAAAVAAIEATAEPAEAGRDPGDDADEGDDEDEDARGDADADDDAGESRQ